MPYLFCPDNDIGSRKLIWMTKPGVSINMTRQPLPVHPTQTQTLTFYKPIKYEVSVLNTRKDTAVFTRDKEIFVTESVLLITS